MSAKITFLRQKLCDNGLDGYYLPRTDYFLSEYLSADDERVAWLYGFSGSAATAVILLDKAILVTDSRYIIQAPIEVDTNVVDVVNINKQTPIAWLCDEARAYHKHCKKSLQIGYDPFLMRASLFAEFTETIDNHPFNLIEYPAFIDNLWQEYDSKPSQIPKAIFQIHEGLYEHNCLKKCHDIAQIVNDNKADYFITIMSDCQAWLLNMRGDDINFNPVFKSYFLLDKHAKGYWFVDKRKISPDLNIPSHVSLYDFSQFNDYIKKLSAQHVILDKKYITQGIINILSSYHVNITDVSDPIINAKAIKSSVEINGMRQAHIFDGAAFTCLLYDLCVTQDLPDELSVINRLESYRQQYTAYRGPSFDTIAAYGAHGAIIHYRANKTSNIQLEEGNLFLCDAGGQYHCGTTDMTRTVFIGRQSNTSPTKEQIKHYTAVLQGHIDLANAYFPHGVTGAQIDSFARRYLWQYGLNYDHGTGHGVGCYLNVHEDGAGIHQRFNKAITAGMTISNEPGYYYEGYYGIRLENVILARQDEKNYVFFETLGLAPYDITLIDKNMLHQDQLQWLDTYHHDICKTLKNYLPEHVFNWLLQQKT